MKRTNHILFAILVFVFITLACNTLLPPSAPNPTQVIESQLTESAGNFPLTEADVPRVTLEEAKVALESGAAVVVDVRDPGQYEESHAAGAISIWLGDIEADPTGVNLDKDQWIITYCT
jgi:hypothetical protein